MYTWEVLMPPEEEPIECAECQSPDIWRQLDMEIANVDGETTVGKRLP
jgi:hypothetical protein